MNEFISQSGWFSYPGLPHSKEALHRVLAKKCKMSYEEFMDCKEAVYKFDYSNGEKVRFHTNHSLWSTLRCMSFGPPPPPPALLPMPVAYANTVRKIAEVL